MSRFYLDMNIGFNPAQNKNTPAFKARNAEIRFADQIMRTANKEFPAVSPSRYISNLINPAIVTREQKLCLINISRDIKMLRLFRPSKKTDPLGYSKKVTYSAKTKHKINCGEMGTIGKLACAVNGIKAERISLKGYVEGEKPVDLDHVFLVFNRKKGKGRTIKDPRTYGKKAIIMDLWSGFVEYAPDAFRKFAVQYQNSRKMKNVERFCVESENFKMNQDIIDYVKEKYPNLVLRK